MKRRIWSGLIFIVVAPAMLTLYLISQRAPAAIEETLQQDIKTQLSLSAEQAMRVDCWRNGGHGSGASIRAFNAQLPAVLAALLSKPEAQTLSLKQIERIFTATTGRYVMLFEGDSTVWLAAIWPLYCAGGSHDSSGTSAYVLDRNGSYWEIDAPRQILAAQWVEDRWIVTADVASTVYAPPVVPELWVILHQAGSWDLADKLLRLTWPETMTVSLEDDYRTLVVAITKPYGDAPCEAVREIPGYSSTTYWETQTYRWQADHYEQISTTAPRVRFVVFDAQNTLPDLSGIGVTPVCCSADNIPYAYHVEVWQPLCQ